MFKLGLFLKVGVSSLVVTGVAVGIPFAVINSKNYNLFTELVVSDNTSILADNSFSETTFEGIRDFLKTKNIDLPPAKDISQASGIWRRPGATTFQRETTFRGLFASGKDMIIAPGFNHETSIRNVSSDSDFFDKGFLLLDSVVSEHNVSSFTFRADQSAFLAGIAASEFLYQNKEIFIRDDGKLKIGGFVGLAFPSTTDFLNGFQAGMIAWNTFTNNDQAKKDTKIEWISLGSTPGSYASGGFGVGQGTAKAQELIRYGADIIMPIAGPQTLDVVGEIISQKNRPIAVVGIDSSQELQSLNKPMPNLAQGQKLKYGYTENNTDMIVQFSAIKRLDKATQSVLDAIFDVNDPNKTNSTVDGVIKGFGFQNIGTIQNKSVGISNAGLPLIEQFSSNWITTNSDGTKEINWSEVSKNQDFLNMTNDHLFYISSPGNSTSDFSSWANINNFISELKGGVAQAIDLLKGTPNEKFRLDGSKWSFIK